MYFGKALLVLVSVGTCLAAIAPRPGWTALADDPIQLGAWSCVSGVTANGPNLTIGGSAPINTGMALPVQGDFSVAATLTIPAGNSAYMTLAGALGGTKRIDVGISNGVKINYWNTSSATPTTRSSPLVVTGTTATFEIARVGTQLIVYVDGVEGDRFADPGLFTSGLVYFGFNVPTQNTLSVSAITAFVPAAPLSYSASLSASWLQRATRTGTGLRDSVGTTGFMLGAAVDPTLLSVPIYAQTLGREFNLVVAENAMKFGATEAARGQFSFCQAEQILAFAAFNGMKARGHNLVWHQSLPNWLNAGNFTPAEASGILQNHITNVVSHFKGQVIAWDVVNEGLSNSSPYGLQASYWLTALGTGYIDQVFRWARAADPSVKLFYNDYNGEGLSTKSTAIYNLVSGMISRGVPIDGVGLEMHLTLTGAPSAADISANIRRLGQLGLEVHITEMDVRIPTPATTADLATQADIYSRTLAACLENTNCTSFLTWGVSDANSWIPGSFPGFGAALLFDQAFVAKASMTTATAALKTAVTKPRIYYGGMVIHGGVAPSVSPGSLVDIYGSNMAAAPVQLPSAVTSLPTTLGGVMVLVNGVAVPLIYVSPDVTIFQMPWDAAVGTASVVVISNGVQSATALLNVKPSAPSILTYNGNRAVVLNQDYSVNCATAGSFGVAFAIGSGPLDNALETGAFAKSEPLSRLKNGATVTIGGLNAPVTFAGMAPGFAGLMQINFVVPSVAPGDHPIQVTIGAETSNQPLVCVR